MASDATFSGWLDLYDGRRAEIKALEEANRTLRDERILPELERRGATMLDLGPYRVRRKTRTTTHYDPKRLHERYGRRPFFREMFKPDHGAIKRLMAEGKVDDPCIASTEESHPYIELDRLG